MQEHELFLGSIFAIAIFLLHWEVWFVILVNIVANFGLFVLVAMMAAPFIDSEEKRNNAGCLLLIINAVVQGVGRSFLMAASIGYVLPILMGHPHASTWVELMEMLPRLFGASIYASLCVFGLCMIPVVGQLLVASGPGVQAFIQGMIILKSVAEPDIAARLAEVPASIREQQSVDTFFAGGWTLVAYGLVAALLTLLIIMACIGLELLYSRIRNVSNDGDKTSLAMTTVGPSIGVIAGFVALLMYAGYTTMAVYGFTKSSKNAGIVALKEQKLDSAIDYFSAVLVFDPISPQTSALRAYAYNGLQKYDKALADASEALKEEPENSDALSQRGVALMMLNRPKDGVKDFERLVELKPDDIEIRIMRGLAYFALGEYQRGIKDLNLILNDRNIEERLKVPVYNSRAMGYYLMGDYKNSIADCTKSINLDQSRGEAFHCRDLAYRKVGQATLAKNDNEKAKSLGWKRVPWFKE